MYITGAPEGISNSVFTEKLSYSPIDTLSICIQGHREIFNTEDYKLELVLRYYHL